jgi:hypothetical protein
MSRAPIALFAYNRPRHTRATLEALGANVLARESDLHVFADAARKPEAIAGVEEVRRVLRTIEGFKSVTVVDRKSNMGLAASITEGLGGLCERYGRAIVVEDDLATSPHFLDYMNAALDRYDAEDRVMQISGHMFPANLRTPEDAIFLPFITSWGWATWARAWRHYDPLARNYGRLAGDPSLRKRFDLEGHYPYFRMLQAQQQGRIDSWAIRWYLSVFFRQGLALYPKNSMVRNLGFDGTGVNCNVSDFAQSDLDPNFRVGVMPAVVGTTAEIEAVYRALPVPRLSWTSVLSRASRMLGIGA